MTPPSRIRSIRAPDDLWAAITAQADSKALSVNAFVLAALRQALGQSPEPKPAAVNVVKLKTSKARIRTQDEPAQRAESPPPAITTQDDAPIDVAARYAAFQAMKRDQTNAKPNPHNAKTTTTPTIDPNELAARVKAFTHAREQKDSRKA